MTDIEKKIFVDKVDSMTFEEIDKELVKMSSNTPHYARGKFYEMKNHILIDRRTQILKDRQRVN